MVVDVCWCIVRESNSFQTLDGSVSKLTRRQPPKHRLPAELVKARDSETADGARSTSVTSSADPVTASKSAAAHWTSDLRSSRWLLGVARTFLASFNQFWGSSWGKSSKWRLLHSSRAAANCKAIAAALAEASSAATSPDTFSSAHLRRSIHTVDLSAEGRSSKILATFLLMEALLWESPATARASKSIWESPSVLNCKEFSSTGFWRTRLAIAARVWRMTFASSAEESGNCLASSPANGINAPGNVLDKLEMVVLAAATSSEHGASSNTSMVPPFQISKSWATWSGRSQVESRALRTNGASSLKRWTRNKRSSSCKESPSWLVFSCGDQWPGDYMARPSWREENTYLLYPNSLNRPAIFAVMVAALTTHKLAVACTITL